MLNMDVRFPLSSSSFLLLGVNETIKNIRRILRLTMKEMLEELYFADDIALLSHRHWNIQDKTNGMVTMDWTWMPRATKIMQINAKSN